MDDRATFEALAVSLGLGLLVGLQRELVDSRLGGLRTFALVTVLGTLCGIVAGGSGAAGAAGGAGAWIIAGGLLGVIVACAVGNIIAMRSDPQRSPGITTEVAMVVMYAVGVLAAQGHLRVATAVGVAVAIILQAKARLHALAHRLGEKDVQSILLFGAITFIVLPVLPDADHGPYGVWNPRRIWLMVVLVVGMSLGGYIAFKFLGERAGTLLAGLLGGLVSSTATTVSHARRAGDAPGSEHLAGVIVTLATTVVYARVLVEIGVAAPALLPVAAGPIGTMLVVTAAVAAVIWARGRREGGEASLPENPTQIKSALFFAGVYALVLLAVEAARDWLGPRGLYAVAVVSGLTDMDAITLSAAEMTGRDGVRPGVAWRAIVIAAMSNMVFKTGVAASLGGRRMFLWCAPLAGATLVTGGLIIWLWPA